MSRARRFALGIALALFGTLLIVLLLPTAAPQPATGQLPGAAEASLAPATEGPEGGASSPPTTGRTRTESGQSTAAGPTAGDEVELGTPAFTGVLLTPAGAPAREATITALGFRGSIRGWDPEDTRRRPLVTRTARTDAQGRFAIPETPDESLHWLLRCVHPSAPLLELTDLEARPSRTRALGEIRLQAGVRAAGIVLTDAGQPLVDAEVQVLRALPGPRLARFARAELFPLPDARTRTDSQGRFSFTELPPGALRFAAAAPGFVADYSATWDAEAGDEASDLEILLTRAQPQRGRVQTTDGAAIPDARVEARWNEGGRALVFTAADGSFQVDLPADATELVLRVSGTGWAVASERVSPTQRDRLLEITLVHVGALRGRTLDQDGHPLANAQVACFEQSQSRLAQWAPAAVQPLARSISDADGSFTLLLDPGAVRDSRFRVVAWTESHQPESSGTLSFLQRGGLTPAALSEELVLQLRPGLLVRGTVQTPTGEPAVGARVHLRRGAGPVRSGRMGSSLAARAGDVVAATEADASGHFVFTGLSPGDYHLEASRADTSPARGAPFSLVDAPWEEQLRLLLPGGLRGEVRGPREGLTRLQVRATASDGRSATALVAADGRFHLPALATGPYEVDLYADGGEHAGFWGRRQGPALSQQQEVMVLEGQWTELVLPLDASDLSKIRGQVLVDGKAAPSYRLYLVPRGYEGDESGQVRQFVLDQTRSVLTEADGRYQLAGIPELEYWLVLVPPRDAGVGGLGGLVAHDGPVGLARATVAPRAGQTLRHDFALQTARLTGRVFLGEGEQATPARSGVASLLPSEENPGLRPFRVSLDRDGRYAFPPLPAGLWRLDLRCGEAHLRTEPFPLAPGAPLHREDHLRSEEQER